MEYNLLIVLPFYNHLECFSKVAREFSKIKLPVLLINDGSTLENTEGVKKICNDFDLLRNSRLTVPVYADRRELLVFRTFSTDNHDFASPHRMKTKYVLY